MLPPPDHDAAEATPPPGEAGPAPPLAASLARGAASPNVPIQQLAAARIIEQRAPDGTPTLGMGRRRRGTAQTPIDADAALDRPVWRFQYLALIAALLTLLGLIWVSVGIFTSHPQRPTNSTVAQLPPATTTATPPGMAGGGAGTPTNASSPAPTGQPTTPPQPGSFPTNPPAVTATAVNCSAITENAASTGIYGDDGHSGGGTLMGYMGTSIVISRAPNKAGGCTATGIQQLTNVQLLAGTWVETNGSQCAGSAHICGIGGTINQWNAATPNAPTAFNTGVLYGIWSAPWGPKTVYSATDNTPQSTNDPHQQQCVAAFAYFTDNFNVRHYGPNTSSYCWNNS